MPNSKGSKSQQPPPLLPSDHVTENWKEFKLRLKLKRTVSGASDRDPQSQVPLPLHVMGEESIELYNSFTWDNEEDKGDYNQVIEKFENSHVPKKKTVLERFPFNEHFSR